MKLKDYLHFFRWENLLFIVLIQVLIKFILFQKFELSMALNNLHFAILVIATICIAIAGYIINDVQDIETDKINKPNKVFVSKKISKKKANNLFVIFNSVGLLLGFYLSIYINKNSFFIVFLITSLLLYRYAIDLKKRFFIGNLVVSFIVFLSVVLIILFDIVPATNNYNNQAQWHVTTLVLVLSGFAFFITLIREITKDLEDKKGDKHINANTLAIYLGDNKTKNIIVLISIIPFAVISYFAYTFLTNDLFLALFLIVFIALPLLYFMFKIKKANTQKEYGKLSRLLKIIMLFGIMSILLF